MMESDCEIKMTRRKSHLGYTTVDDTHRHVYKGFSFIPRRAGIIFHHEFSIMIKDGFLLFIRNISQIFAKDFDGFGNGDIAAVVSTNNMLALQVGNKHCRSDHNGK